MNIAQELTVDQLLGEPLIMYPDGWDICQES